MRFVTVVGENGDCVPMIVSGESDPAMPVGDSVDCCCKPGRPRLLAFPAPSAEAGRDPC